ncbi:hypothetical protein NEMIN01_2022 [Nematocida minor]|uniref:uncharacterized protein n=1 Tax=Nematocida minor TaxID=1912983 RepID=UPI0022203706|nr:uncharacterized protein NEMIN01_2022 [Nematocida minor]KAI5192458.1 hypothetical protein NEMIN01_2022 [Nematocida minor]
MPNEIDSIFSQKERKKTSTKEKTKKEMHYDIRGKEVKAQATYTEDGYKIYTEQELNIGKGGQTENCPIDCNCCF